MKDYQYIEVSNRTLVRIPNNSQINKVQPPLADFPVEITVYTLNGSTLTVRRMSVPKTTIADIKEMSKLNEIIDRMSEAFKINEPLSSYGYYYGENANATLIKELDNYLSKYKSLRNSFEKVCDENDTKIPLEQYEIGKIDPMEFVVTLEKLKEQFGLGDFIPDSKIRESIVKTVEDICSENESFNDAVANLKKTTILKSIGLGLLLIILNFIVSKAINLTTLINSANLSPIYNILISLGPVAVLSGIGFVSYVQYEEKHGKLVTEHAVNSNLITEQAMKKITYLKKFELEKIKSDQQLSIPKGLDYHPNPETDYQISVKKSATYQTESTQAKIQFLEELKNGLLRSENKTVSDQQTKTKQAQKVMTTTNYHRS